MPDESTRRKQQAIEIAQREMPGWKAVTEEEEDIRIDMLADVAPSPVDAILPSLDTLRQKYLGTPATDATAASDALEPDEETEIVTLTAKGLSKKAGVNVKSGRIEWIQDHLTSPPS